VRRDAFTLFWSIQPTEQDWRNLNASKVKRVMLTYDLALHDRAMLAHLASLQKRVVIRLTEENVFNIAPAIIRQRLDDIVRTITVDAVILGCEPENGFDMEYGSPNWGNRGDQPWVWHHAARVSLLHEALDGMPFKRVSPGWTMRSISEDEAPQPGVVTWAECTRMAYNKFDGNAAHIYQYGWTSVVDELRFKFALKEAQARHHKPVWIDEVGISSGSDVERMRAYIAIATMLLQHKLGDRVEMLCPFISTGDPGDPPAWDGRLLIRDAEAYRLLGAFMAAG
jgi:hypothetical protein